jgi:tetratricopeptide (TPR) repeat protein
VVEGIDPEEDDRAFSRAIELDSTYAPAYMHPMRTAFNRADSARAADLIRAYRRLNPAHLVDVLELSFALGFGDTATRLRARAALDTVPTPRLSGVMGTLTHPRFRTVEEEVIEKLLRRPDHPAPHEALIGAWYVRLGSGKLRQALETLDDPPAGLRFAAYTYFPYTSGLPVPPERLDRELVLGESDSVSDLMTFYAGAYAADRGRWAEHAKAVSRLRAQSSGRKLIAPWWVQSVAGALEGYGLWRRGQKEEALRRMEVAQAGTTLSLLDFRHWMLLRTITAWHGRLLLELDRPRDAIPYFKTTAFGLAQDALDAYYLGRAYEASNQPEEARSAYEYFAAAWKDADPELRPMVEEALRSVRRLESAIQE